jgi:hypothetical protein
MERGFLTKPSRSQQAYWYADRRNISFEPQKTDQERKQNNERQNDSYTRTPWRSGSIILPSIILLHATKQGGYYLFIREPNGVGLRIHK